ncbi:MAG: TlpA disulfide reductase family protein [Caenibius sp.]
MAHWFNTEKPLALDQLRSKVVVIEAFQMLCPGCVSHGLPQAARIARVFSRQHVEIIGLHCVFEHHEAQGTPAALTAFIHEYCWPFPIGLDAAADHSALPQTMQAYALQGTPSLILIDRQGVIRETHVGQVDDMAVGAQIMALVKEGQVAKAAASLPDKGTGGCSAQTGTCS